MNKLLFVFLLLLSFGAWAQTAEIKGVVTYTNSRYQITKPDVGATILIQPVDTAVLNKNIFYRYQLSTLLLSMFNPKHPDATIQNKLKSFGIDSKESYKKLDKETYDALATLRTQNNVQILAADGAGNFSLKVPPGVYQIVVISKSVPYPTLTEYNGKIDWTYGKIKSDTQFVYNSDFIKD